MAIPLFPPSLDGRSYRIRRPGQDFGGAGRRLRIHHGLISLQTLFISLASDCRNTISGCNGRQTIYLDLIFMRGGPGHPGKKIEGSGAGLTGTGQPRISNFPVATAGTFDAGAAPPRAAASFRAAWRPPWAASARVWAGVSRAADCDAVVRALGTVWVEAVTNWVAGEDVWTL